MTDTFSTAQYTAVIDKIHDALAEATAKLQRLPSDVVRALDHWYIPNLVINAVKSLINKIAGIVQAIFDKIMEIMKGSVAPFKFWHDSGEWSEISGKVNSVAGGLKSESLQTHKHWKGNAYDAYLDVAMQNERAATQLGTIAGKISNSLAVCAGAGVVFYIGILAAVLKAIWTLTAASVAASTGIGAPAAVAAVVIDAGLIIGIVMGLLAMLATALSPLITEMSALNALTTDNGAFPGVDPSDPYRNPQWPVADTQSFNKVTDSNGKVQWELK